MCQIRSAYPFGAYSSIPLGCSRMCPSESMKRSFVAVMCPPCTPITRCASPHSDALALRRQAPPLEETTDQRLFEPRVRRVRDRRIDAGRLRQHALLVAERVEARAPVIRADAARPDATERKFRDCEVHHRRVQCDTARRGLLDDPFLHRLRF